MSNPATLDTRHGVEPDHRAMVDALADDLTRVGTEVQALAERIGLPDPGAAKTEDLIRDLWAVVHANTPEPAGADEGRVLGWYA